jgi:hypothetical protein
MEAEFNQKQIDLFTRPQNNINLAMSDIFYIVDNTLKLA